LHHRAVVTGTAASLIDEGGRVAEVARELVRRRADLVDHAQGSLEQHLVGAHDVLRAWEQPERVRLAGLLHSGYSTEAFGFRMFGPKERARVRELVGGAAERLVFAFCACSLEKLRAAVARGGPARVATRWDGGPILLERRDLAELLVIHAANLADQTCRPSGAPAPWLARAAELLESAREGVEVLPPVLAALAGMNPERETALHEAYASLLPAGSTEGAPPPAPLDAWPVGEPFVLAGLRALSERRGRDAALLGRRAIAAFDACGTAWDKRLTLGRWRAIAELLVRDGETCDRELDTAGRRARSALDVARGSPQRVWARLDSLAALPSPSAPPRPVPSRPPAAGPLPPRFEQFIAGLRTNRHRPVMHFYPGLRTKPWHDATELPIVADLERSADVIAAEARALEAARFQDEAEEIGRTGRWSVLFLFELGRRNESNLARCPVTATSRASTRGRASRPIRGPRTCACVATSASRSPMVAECASAGSRAAGRKAAAR
jgi:hypothetical protein